ncbi:nucleolar protein 12 [Anolis carolinensis]|uniref:Nucleolar protein 12 n=1 Tax=Anolis carolinensis TaxID=28377 RepID=G1KR91_ANOCA|nr:PREDICTED: nucleolar protein 12 [Anolis carolinensis]|eukprot:XP_003220998.1 PREDICTED: nucleolar protein 12 [Anolis carolinensis]
MGRKKKRRDASSALRRIVTFDEENRREYLTGFHKRKVERRKIAMEEIRRKLKEEQKKMKEERHKEYMKMLKEREDALEEADELEHLVTSRTESVSYDHPGHTVTVTTVSDLDLSGARLLGLDAQEEKGEEGGVEKEDTSNQPTLPKKSKEPLLSQRISSLTASLHSRSQRKKKGKLTRHNQGKKKPVQKPTAGRTSKRQRRKMTGKRRHIQE